MSQLDLMNRGEREQFILEFIISKNENITVGEALKELQDYENRRGKNLNKRA